MGAASVSPERNLLFGLLALQIRPDRPGPARRRVPGLDARQGSGPRPPTSSRAATLTPTSAPVIDAMVGPAPEEARRRRREEPRRHSGRPCDSREPGADRRPGLEASLGTCRHGSARPMRSATPTAPPATPSARPPRTASGSACCGRMPEAAWARSSSRSTPS